MIGEIEGGEALLPDAQRGRWLRRRQAGGVAIVSILAGGEFHGSTLSAWIVTSIQPLQVLLSLEEESALREWIEEAGVFVVNIMPWREQFHADQFAGLTPRASPTFAGIEHRIGSLGAPILTRSLCWVECRIASTFVTGDHACVVGDVVALGVGDGAEEDPLVYYLNRYRRFESR